ncbi:MAG: ABC transporter substrate-binding protein [Actinobacteria bacterium]|nr:ABC transporter substrate-binding protein [Actinomycetota bacterium]
MVVSSGGVTNTCAKTDKGLFYTPSRKLSGSLTVVCGATEAWCGAMTKAFTNKTGVNTKFVRLSSGETVARLDAAKNNPEFDVWHGGPADGFGVARIGNLIEKYLSPTRNMIPAKYQDTDGYWTGVYVGALGFCSNTKELKRLGVAVPRSWADLLNPKLKRQISTAHPSTSGTAFTTLWTQVTRLGSEEAGIAYMKKLHNNILQYTKSGVGPVQIVGRGEAAIGIVFSHDCVAGAEQGLPLKVSFPSEGTGYEIGGVALVKGAKNPEAAKAYIDFALSAEAQNLGPTVAAYQVLTNPRTKLDRRMVALKKLAIVNYDFEKAAASKKALTARFDSEVAVAPKV